jgi:hypothetical protein
VDSWDADVVAFVRVAFVLLLRPEEARDHVDAPMLFVSEPPVPPYIILRRCGGAFIILRNCAAEGGGRLLRGRASIAEGSDCI